MKRRKHGFKWLVIMLIIISVLFGGFYIYTLDYYKADETAILALDTDKVSVEKNDKRIIFYPKESSTNLHTAFIFYPGGKVEAASYAPLLVKLAENGVTCILMKMPFHLAVFDINAANKVVNKLPGINDYYIGGHSLGGAMASSYVKKHSGNIKGLILLAAYPVADISNPMIAIYGSNDGVLNTDKLNSTKNIVKIEGGNHAYFGNYGEQAGDGTASITREEQQEETVTAIMEFIKKNQL